MKAFTKYYGSELFGGASNKLYIFVKYVSLCILSFIWSFTAWSLFVIFFHSFLGSCWDQNRSVNWRQPKGGTYILIA